MISQGRTEASGNARANIPNASKERNHQDTPGYSRVLFKCIPGTQSIWRVVSINRLKKLNAHIDTPHFHMHTISSVLNAVERGDHVFKIDLQDPYFHVLIHSASRKYLRFAFENKVYQFRVLPFGLNIAPQVLTPLGHR